MLTRKLKLINTNLVALAADLEHKVEATATVSIAKAPEE